MEAQHDQHVLTYAQTSPRKFSRANQVWSSCSHRGEQPVQATPGNNKRVYAFGTYEPASKRFLYQIHLRKRCSEFKGFLQGLLAQVSRQALSRDVSELLRKVRTGLASFQGLVKIVDTA